MNAKTTENIERELFCQAMELDTSDRAAWLQERCAGDVQLRARLLRLLEKHDLLESDQALQTSGAEVEGAGGRILQDSSATEQTLITSHEDTGRDKLDDADEFPEEPVRRVWKSKKTRKAAPQDNDDEFQWTHLRHYEILETIGRGAMGVVLKAEDTRLKRTVAIKVMSSHAIPDEHARERFEREAQLAASVQHENLVTIHAVDRVNGSPFIVMEYIDGITLNERIRQEEKLSADEIVAIARQLAAGLAAAHEKGMMHRDIKPGNIMLDRQTDNIRIVDFGLARAVDDSSLTSTGSVIGTPRYISPEQAQGLNVDHRADLFSMGCVLYAMFVGVSPFHATSVVAVLQKVCFEKEQRLSAVAPSVPPWLESLIHQMLNKNPDARPQSANDILETINRHTRAATEAKPFSLRRFLLKSAAIIAGVACLMAATDASGITDFSGYVLRVAKGHGTLQIRVSEPGMQVSVDGDAYQFTSANDLSATFNIPPGNHIVEARRGGRLVSKKLFAIERFGKELVDITWEPDPVVAPETLSEISQPVAVLNEQWTTPTVVDLQSEGGTISGRPSVTADGLTLVFETDRDGTLGRTDLWISERATSDSEFAVPRSLGSEVNSDAKESDAFISSDGRHLLFVASRHRGGYKNEIWQASRSSGSAAFTDPERVRELNSEEHDGGCTLSGDGLMIILASTREGGEGDSDLWITHRASVKDRFSEVVNLGSVVNSKYRDCSPFLTSDGLELWFTSDRPGTRGRRDIWVSRRDSPSDAFGPPMNAGPVINSEFDEESPTLTADGQLFFESMRPNGDIEPGLEKIWTCRRLSQSKTPIN